MKARTPAVKEKKPAFKSGKQRRVEIKARRGSLRPAVIDVDPLSLKENWPKGAIAANQDRLVHSGYELLPYFYVDKPFTCRDCGSSEVWRATQQRWWYEVAKGVIGTTAVRCKSCRRKERERKETARAVSLPGLLAKQARP